VSDGLNRATLLGNVGQDPELRKVSETASVLAISLATSISYWDEKQQDRVQRTEWHRVALWGKRAEGIAGWIRKGDRLYVEGEIRTKKYEKDGVTHYSTEIHATNVILLGTRRKEDEASKSGDDDLIPF